MIWMYHKSYTLTDLRIPSPNSSLESDSREGVLVELMSVFAGMLHVDPVVPSARGRGYLLVPNIWFGLGESSLYSKVVTPLFC